MKRLITAFAIVAALACAQKAPEPSKASPQTKRLSAEDELEVRNAELKATRLGAKLLQDREQNRAQYEQDMAQAQAAQKILQETVQRVGEKNGCAIGESGEQLTCTVTTPAAPTKAPPKNDASKK